MSESPAAPKTSQQLLRAASKETEDVLKSLSSVCTVTQEDDMGEAGVGWQALRELADTFVFCQQSSRDRRAKIMPDSESHPVVLAARFSS